MCCMARWFKNYTNECSNTTHEVSLRFRVVKTNICPLIDLWAMHAFLDEGVGRGMGELDGKVSKHLIGLGAE